MTDFSQNSDEIGSLANYARVVETEPKQKFLFVHKEDESRNFEVTLIRTESGEFLWKGLDQ